MADPNYATKLLETQLVLPVEVGLTGEEKMALNRMMAPEGALWKIMRGALANADQLKDGIASIPLVGDANIQRARQLQLQRDCAIQLLSWIAQQTQPTPPIQPLSQQG